MKNVVLGVENNIKKELPDKFALIFDGWSEHNTHYTAIFASYNILNGTKIQTKNVLLSFSPYEDETDLSAEALKDHILSILQYYGKSMNNVVCMVADNCATNISAVVNHLRCFMIGCYSHKLNLVVSKLFQASHESLDKCNALMTQLKTLKRKWMVED
jgi:hypothetical protein